MAYCPTVRTFAFVYGGHKGETGKITITPWNTPVLCIPTCLLRATPCGCMGFVWVHAESILRCVASPFHSFVTTLVENKHTIPKINPVEPAHQRNPYSHTACKTMPDFIHVSMPYPLARFCHRYGCVIIATQEQRLKHRRISKHTLLTMQSAWCVTDCWLCYTEKATKAWHRQGSQKTINTYNQPRRPSNGTTHRTSTRHQLKSSPRVKCRTPASTATVHAASTTACSHYHADPAGPLPESSQPTQLSAQRRRAEPHYSTDTARPSGDTCGTCLPGGPVIRRM